MSVFVGILVFITKLMFKIPKFEEFSNRVLQELNKRIVEEQLKESHKN